MRRASRRGPSGPGIGSARRRRETARGNNGMRPRARSASSRDPAANVAIIPASPRLPGAMERSARKHADPKPATPAVHRRSRASRGHRARRGRAPAVRSGRRSPSSSRAHARRRGPCPRVGTRRVRGGRAGAGRALRRRPRPRHRGRRRRERPRPLPQGGHGGGARRHRQRRRHAQRVRGIRHGVRGGPLARARVGRRAQPAHAARRPAAILRGGAP